MSEFWMNDLVWRHSCPVGWDSVDFPLGADLRGVAEEKRSRHPGSRGFGARWGTKVGLVSVLVYAEESQVERRLG